MTGEGRWCRKCFRRNLFFFTSIGRALEAAKGNNGKLNLTISHFLVWAANSIISVWEEKLCETASVSLPQSQL